MLGYLINPALQLEDINGLPLVGGWLTVYRAGTTQPYITYRDFDMNRNPVNIMLNDKGMAVILCDSELYYDVYAYDRHGVQQWSRLNVCTIGSGSGGGDDPEALEWFRGESYAVYGESDIYVPLKVDGTMDVLEDGVQVYGDRYYHITAHLSAVRETAAPYYDSFDVRIVGQSEHPQSISEQHFTIDWSMGLVQDFEISTDFMCKEDGSIRFYVEGVGDYGEVQLKDVEIHRVYSGIADVPGHLLTKEEANQLYQGKLTEGRGIDIDQNNVISVSDNIGTQSDWWVNDSTSMAFIRHKPDMTEYATQSQVSALTAQIATLSNTVTQLSSAVSTLQTQMSHWIGEMNTLSGQVSTMQTTMNSLNNRYMSHGNNYDSTSHTLSHVL